jgi:signal transduction histidine kinase
VPRRIERLVHGLRRVSRSARLRIVASNVLLLVCAAAISFVAIRQLLAAQLETRIRDDLVQEVQEFRRLVGGRDPRTGEPFGADYRAIFDVYLSRNVPASGEVFLTFLGERPYQSTRGEQAIDLLRSNPELASRWGRLTRSESGEVATPAGPARYLAVPIGSARGVGARFVVANFIAEERDQVEATVRVAGAVSLAVIVIGTGLALLVSGRVLAPLRELTETAHAISETDLRRRIVVDGDDELAELGRTFNSMLDRLDDAFSSQRQLLRDVGHELRTPLAIVSGHLELVGDDPEERRETLELVRDELERMGRLVDDLVLLARAERPDFLELETVDLGALSSELLAKASALADREWALERRGAGRIVADRQRLTQAMMNLVGNAVLHTQPGDSIALGAETRDGRARLWVRDSGPGIAEGDRERIFERFARGTDERRDQGTGLGLAIVRAIAEAHGGEVRLESAPGEGACFALELPIDPPEPRR